MNDEDSYEASFIRFREIGSSKQCLHLQANSAALYSKVEVYNMTALMVSGFNPLIK